MSDQSLKSFYDRIWALMDEREGIQADIRDVFDEAKDAGYVPKVLRKIITRHRAKDQSKLQREDALQSDYEATLDGKTKAVLAELRAGTTFDATAEKTGVPRRTVARLAEAVPEKKESGTQDVPHDPETGEIKATEVAVPPGDGEAPDLRGSAGTPSPIIEAGGNAPAACSEPDSSLARPTRPVGEAEIADRSNDADDLTIPSFLRGSRQRVAA